MDDNRFDQIVRALGDVGDRRSAVKALLGGTLAGALGVVGLNDADARNKGKGKDKKGKKGRDKGKDPGKGQDRKRDRGRGDEKPEAAQACAAVGQACGLSILTGCCGEPQCSDLWSGSCTCGSGKTACGSGNSTRCCTTSTSKCCGSTCIATSACCTNNSPGCPNTQTCNNGTCGCASGQKLCGSTCIATSACCTNNNPGCSSGNTCVGGSCCANDKVCGSGANRVCCGNNQVCRLGACATAFCPPGEKLCSNTCISVNRCCTNGIPDRCPFGQFCDRGTCAPFSRRNRRKRD